MLTFLRKRLDDQANQHVGLLAEFSDPGALYDAVKSLRKKGYTRLDTFSPFPIHGMDAAMGLKTSPIGFFAFVGGATGLGLAILMQWWMGEVDYAINISNKPLFAWESSVPIMFELTVLFTALTAIGAMLAANGLPKPYNPLFFSERFSRSTDDGFFLHIAAADGQFRDDATAGDLFDAGALFVETVSHDGAEAVSRAGDAVVRQPDAQPDAGAHPVTPAHTTGDL